MVRKIEAHAHSAVSPLSGSANTATATQAGDRANKHKSLQLTPQNHSFYSKLAYAATDHLHDFETSLVASAANKQRTSSHTSLGPHPSATQTQHLSHHLSPHNGAHSLAPGTAHLSLQQPPQHHYHYNHAPGKSGNKWYTKQKLLIVRFQIFSGHWYRYLWLFSVSLRLSSFFCSLYYLVFCIL